MSLWSCCHSEAASKCRCLEGPTARMERCLHIYLPHTNIASETLRLDDVFFVLGRPPDKCYVSFGECNQPVLRSKSSMIPPNLPMTQAGTLSRWTFFMNFILWMSNILGPCSEPKGNPSIAMSGLFCNPDDFKIFIDFLLKKTMCHWMHGSMSCQTKALLEQLRPIYEEPSWGSARVFVRP